MERLKIGGRCIYRVHVGGRELEVTARSRSRNLKPECVLFVVARCVWYVMLCHVMLCSCLALLLLYLLPHQAGANATYTIINHVWPRHGYDGARS